MSTAAWDEIDTLQLTHYWLELAASPLVPHISSAVEVVAHDVRREHAVDPLRVADGPLARVRLTLDDPLPAVLPLLEGVRGEQGADLALLEETLLRLSQLAQRHPSIQELDLNPFLAAPGRDNAKAVDARIRVAR